MKIYCKSCDKVQPVIIDHCKDAKTGEPYEDIMCTECKLVIASGTGIAPKQEPVALDVTLNEEESEFLRDTIGADDVSPIRLLVGDGHSGHGLYVANADYQEEGAALVVNTEPTQRKRVQFPTMLRKMWSGGEVQAWLDENVNKADT